MPDNPDSEIKRGERAAEQELRDLQKSREQEFAQFLRQEVKGLTAEEFLGPVAPDSYHQERSFKKLVLEDSEARMSRARSRGSDES